MSIEKSDTLPPPAEANTQQVAEHVRACFDTHLAHHDAFVFRTVLYTVCMLHGHVHFSHCSAKSQYACEDVLAVRLLQNGRHLQDSKPSQTNPWSTLPQIQP